MGCDLIPESVTRKSAPVVAMTYQPDLSADDELEDVSKQRRMLLLRALVKSWEEMHRSKLCSGIKQVGPFRTAISGLPSCRTLVQCFDVSALWAELFRRESVYKHL